MRSRQGELHLSEMKFLDLTRTERSIIYQSLLYISYISNIKCKVVNTPSHGSSLDWTDICNKSSKVITFVDLAGHEKYLKTTVFGLTGN